MNRHQFNRRIVVGTPVTPKHLLTTHQGGSFCVSFARPDQLDECIELVGDDQIVLLDNGAFSIWNTKRRIAAGDKKAKLPPRLKFKDAAEYREAFWAWANEAQDRCPNAIAVIPDVITGSEQSNLEEVSWALREGQADYPEKTMAIWHLDESLEQLETLCRVLNFVGFGSCDEYDVQKKRPAYLERIRQASEVVDRVEREHGRRPWIHLMRGLDPYPELCRFDSADSSNAAVNHCRYKKSHGDQRSRFIRDRTWGYVHDAIDAAEIERVESNITNFDDAPTRRPRLAA